MHGLSETAFELTGDAAWQNLQRTYSKTFDQRPVRSTKTPTVMNWKTNSRLSIRPQPLFVTYSTIGEPVRNALEHVQMSAATGMGFERKHSLFDDLISGYSSNPLRRVPNIDVELNGQRGSDNLVIECKFTEPFVKYEETHRPFTSTYFRSEAEPIWAGLSSTRELATQINRGLEIFERLDATQLIKTGLACQRRFGPGCWRFVYLWYEVTHSGHMTEECGVLTAELTRFRELTYGELPVSGMTWQELFNRIEAVADPNDSRYTAYLRDRYFDHA